MVMKKLLYITPHLSTGGLPQYLLKKIEHFQNDFDIHVIEYQDLSWEFVVQKNKIKQLISPTKFATLGTDKTQLLEYIERWDPDIIHIEETPESFIANNLIVSIFTKPNRKYFILTTTHSSHTNPADLNFMPDKFVLVSEWSKQKFESVVDVPCDIWEYPIEDLKSEKEKYQEELGFDKEYFHILNVGLFTSGKNQSEVFEIAKQLQDLPIKFHFVGNQAMNFKDYWGPLIETKPENCIVWGERNDVNKFLQASDIFYFSSILELNPLVIKEALSYKLPILMRRLHTYLDQYDNNPLVNYIDNNLETTKQLILSYDI
jgi:glycosyltransferase involved in cell wall biosynthesis